MFSVLFGVQTSAPYPSGSNVKKLLLRKLVATPIDKAEQQK